MNMFLTFDIIRCLRGGDDDCWCQDPTVPLPRPTFRSWSALHQENKAKASNPPPNLDVVLLGDQLIQAWTGRFRLAEGQIVGRTEIRSFFNQTFHRAQGGLVEGIAMGIEGDTASNLLWRIQNGEMPAGLNPKGTSARFVRFLSANIGARNAIYSLCSTSVSSKQYGGCTLGRMILQSISVPKRQ
jgi:hypothetical protein